MSEPNKVVVITSNVSLLRRGAWRLDTRKHPRKVEAIERAIRELEQERRAA